MDIYQDFGSYKHTVDLDALFVDYPFMSVDAAYTEYIDDSTLFVLLFKRDMFWKYKVSYSISVFSKELKCHFIVFE